MINILLRLSGSCLLRMRCVCKDWCNLIDSPTFIHAHLQHSKATPCFLAFDSSKNQYCVISKLPPPHGKIGHLEIPCDGLMSTCNGLLCIKGKNSDEREEFHVVNPAIGEVKALPPISSIYTRLLCVGCQTSREDMISKAVHVLDQYGATFCQVLTLGVDDSWRNLDGAYSPALNCICGPPVRDYPCINGALHWISKDVRRRKVLEKGSDGRNEFIVAFNIRDEKFRTMSRPDCCEGYNDCDNRSMLHHEMRLVDIGGLLGLLHLQADMKYMDIWVLKNYERKEWVMEDHVCLEWIHKELDPLSSYRSRLAVDVHPLQKYYPHICPPAARFMPSAVVDGDIFLHVNIDCCVRELDLLSTIVTYYIGLKRFQKFEVGGVSCSPRTASGTFVESLVNWHPSSDRNDSSFSRPSLCKWLTLLNEEERAP